MNNSITIDWLILVVQLKKNKMKGEEGKSDFIFIINSNSSTEQINKQKWA